MENTNTPQDSNPSNSTQTNSFLPQKKLPNAIAVLVLGIISMPTCFCYGIIGMACGIIALVLAKKDMMLYNANPNDYEVSSFNNLKAGRVCAIIGLALSALYLIYIIVVMAIVGTAFTMMPWGQMMK